MTEKRREKDSEREERPNLSRRLIFIIIAAVISAFLVLAGFDRGGSVGVRTYETLSYLFGIGYFLIPLALIPASIFMLYNRNAGFMWLKTTGLVFFIIGFLGGASFFFSGSGGTVGNQISALLESWFDAYAAGIILGAILVISALTVFDIHILYSPLLSSLERLRGRFKKSDDSVTIVGGNSLNEESSEMEPPAIKGAEYDSYTAAVTKTSRTSRSVEEDDIVLEPRFGRAFTPPPLSLLERDRGRADVGDIKANANIIKRTLQNFGIVVEMDEISIGPTVTRYALKPAEGVKLSRIVALQNDLALALAAPGPIRIEAPIPGKSLVGVEIPNDTKSTVGLGNLLASEEFQTSAKPLYFALGKGISGKTYFANLGKMPHLLIAGSTGSGKSVAIHAIVTSLLYRNSPEDLRFMMVDPKRVELTLYNKIPHLLTPVITDAKKTIMSLRWAAKEMERRYNILESESVRDIESYHKNIYIPAVEKYKEAEEKSVTLPEHMPYIVIVIDELADIMSLYPRELEAAVIRLAQMSRAVGIHLVLSTQRPSVNVITGLIKANIPARIALQVASQIDSRTILDMSGAEKLLGAGDMLYLSGEMSQPERIQCPYISEHEVKKVVGFLRDEYKNELPDEILLGGDTENRLFNDGSSEDDVDDDLYEKAREEVMKAGKASTSYLQRKLRVGYARAARLVDMLEERGVIGPSDGSKAREVIGATTTKANEENTGEAADWRV